MIDFDLRPLLFLVLVAVVVAFGAGYGCRACDYRPHIEMRKVSR